MAGATLPFDSVGAWLSARIQREFPSLRQAAFKLRVDRGTLAGYANGEKVPPDLFVRRFAREFGDDEGAALELARRTRAVQDDAAAMPVGAFEATEVLFVPIVSDVGAGGGYVTEGIWAMTPIRGASRDLVAFRVRGDSLLPRIEAGELLIVDRRRNWSDGDLVVARVGDELLAKRWYKEGDQVRLKADAPGYADVVDGDVEVIGVVIASQRLFM
jgi:SOS-response transcriptional repressor LexA